MQTIASTMAFLFGCALMIRLATQYNVTMRDCHELALKQLPRGRSERCWKQRGSSAVLRCRPCAHPFDVPYEIREIIQQTYMVGWRSLPLILTSGAAIGVVLSMHTRAVMERFGAESLIPSALAIALIGETGPLMTWIAGRRPRGRRNWRGTGRHESDRTD
jgi:hypothetical protein